MNYQILTEDIIDTGRTNLACIILIRREAIQYLADASITKTVKTIINLLIAAMRE